MKESKTQKAFYVSDSEAQYLECIGGGNRSRGLRLSVLAHAEANGNLLNLFKTACDAYKGQPNDRPRLEFRQILDKHLQRHIKQCGLEADADLMPTPVYDETSIAGVSVIQTPKQSAPAPEARKSVAVEVDVEGIEGDEGEEDDGFLD